MRSEPKSAAAAAAWSTLSQRTNRRLKHGWLRSPEAIFAIHERRRLDKNLVAIRADLASWANDEVDGLVFTAATAQLRPDGILVRTVAPMTRSGAPAIETSWLKLLKSDEVLRMLAHCVVAVEDTCSIIERAVSPAFDPKAVADRLVVASLLVMDINLDQSPAQLAASVQFAADGAVAVDGRGSAEVSAHAGDLDDRLIGRLRRRQFALAGGQPIRTPSPQRINPKITTARRRREIIAELLRAFPDNGPRKQWATWQVLQDTRRKKAGPGAWLADKLKAAGLAWPSELQYKADRKAARKGVEP